ncbi:hypothetical protein CBR_g22842 [Chara braunii]|uniref:Uncharacterized protein n=1 Tax=Chara braunii TaxID=69332 RepID=A0A388L2W2_CHABU|nr:hypothetical protein CBR_g22842 [Chara braunii]|eukprot:GBG76626.1 hypothetical protein CBR_g22842 [Chara braunii]
MEKSNVSSNMAVETIACTTEDLYEDISNVIARDGAHKQCVRSPGTGVTDNDTNQEKTLQMESEEMLAFICVAANEDADNGEGTGNEDTSMCTVISDCITKTERGTQFLYDINWEPDKVQPGLNGGKHCLAFKSGETWVPYPPPKLATWSYIMAAIIFDRLTRLNDGVALPHLIKCTHVLWEALIENGGLRLNDLFYDREDCSQQWVVSDSTRVWDGVCNDNDARRDAWWGWVPSTIPCEYGEIKMLVRDLNGNCWSTVYIDGEFSSHYLEYEMAESFDVAAGEPLIPLQNPVFSPIVEGKVFLGEDNICLRQGGGVGADPCSDFPDNCLSVIRRRHGRSTLLGWVPVVCPMRYASGADLSMEFREPLGVPFFVTYSDGLLRHIEYMVAEDMKGNDYNAGSKEPQFEETGQPACEANQPPEDAPGGCDVDGPTAHSGAGRAVVEKSAPVTGTVCTDGSRRTGQGTKQKATTKRDNGGTTTVAGKGGWGSNGWWKRERKGEGAGGGSNGW